MIDFEIEKFIKEQNHVTIGFSGGKDSLCCTKIIKDIGVPFTPFYFYHVPDLEFVNKTLKMYEDFFETKIIQLPHPMLYDHLRHQDYMSEQRAEFVDEYNFGKITFRDMIDFWLSEKGLPEQTYDINGMRSADSFNRRQYFKKYGWLHEPKLAVYPIWNWTKQNCFDYLTKNKVPISVDYEIWDRSWDGLNYQWVVPLKKNFPDDFDRIKEYFPLIELEIKRYEFNKKYFVG